MFGLEVFELWFFALFGLLVEVVFGDFVKLVFYGGFDLTCGEALLGLFVWLQRYSGIGGE